MNNNVLSAGIPLPYWNLEFLTHTTFHPHAAIIVLDLFYNDEDNWDLLQYFYALPKLLTFYNI